MCSSCFSSQNSTVESEEQIFLRHQPAKPFQNHILSFGGTRKCSAHKGNYRKLSLINTKKIPDKVMSEDLGHLPFLLLSIHYFCSGQIFSKALTAQLKAELLCTAYCSLSLTYCQPAWETALLKLMVTLQQKHLLQAYHILTSTLNQTTREKSNRESNVKRRKQWYGLIFHFLSHILANLLAGI